MLFNSIDFAVFLPIVFTIYWLVNRFSLRFQNGLLVLASYIFYGWWDYRFLSLIILSTLVDYLLGLKLAKAEKKKERKWLLACSLIVNLGLLGFFKYYNFFLDNFIASFSFLGATISASSLNIILPVGISFYTFQTLSYTIDIYRGKISPTRDLVAFAAFVSFFPQLVAGPIERATNLLPQFFTHRTFDSGKAVDGLRQILWGLFKKIVIADNCAYFVNLIFGSSSEETGSTLFLGAFLFAFQIYADFSGYSDIALGTSRLFGFNLMRNFAFPYFSRDIAEFWRRWHISLSTWFRDYLYIPLGGSRGGLLNKIRNVFAIFIVSGFWHGANWTFIIWGLLNALYFLPVFLLQRNRQNMEIVAMDRLFPRISEIAQIIVTFFLTTLAWIFFRAESVTQAFEIVSEIFSMTLFSIPDILLEPQLEKTLHFILGMIVLEWLGRKHQYALEHLALSWYRPARWSLYLFIAILIALNTGKEQDFIYFQF